MDQISFQILINANVQKVWTTMLADATYRKWTSHFNPTSYYEGDWSEGSEIKFLGFSESGHQEGMYSKILENIPLNLISIQHLGMISNGIIDTTSEAVKVWAPSLENYYFTKISDTQTELKIKMDISEEYKSMFEELWPKALNELKSLCETN